MNFLVAATAFHIYFSKYKRNLLNTTILFYNIL